MPITGDTFTDVTEFYRLCESGHKELKAIRQKGKGPTFGLAYGAFPPKVASSLKISLPAAEAIFNSYHNELYPGITRYREEYVLPTALEHGKVHLGLGCYIKTDNPGKDIRTINNATAQFWSILTLLTINRMHQLIDEADMQDSVQCISSIYDSIYYVVKDDPTIIKWVNDNLVPIMTQDWMENQTIKNEATAEIGLDWCDMEQIPSGSDETAIAMTLDIINHGMVGTTSAHNHKFTTTYTIDKKTKIKSVPLSCIEHVQEWHDYIDSELDKGIPLDQIQSVLDSL